MVASAIAPTSDNKPDLALPAIVWFDLRINRHTPSAAATFDGHALVSTINPPTTHPSQLIGRKYACVAIELDIPDKNSMEFIADFRSRHPQLALLVFTLEHSEDFALWALRQHVWDLQYLPMSNSKVTDIARNLAELPRYRSNQHAEAILKPLAQGTSEYQTRLYLRNPTSRSRFRTIVQNYLAGHLAEKIRCADLAKVCKLSYLQFSRAFREEFDCTFQEYLMDYRINAAKQALRQSDMQIATIADLTGFTDPSYFTRVFTRMTGSTPSKYREISSRTCKAPPLGADDSASHSGQQLTIPL